MDRMAYVMDRNCSSDEHDERTVSGVQGVYVRGMGPGQEWERMITRWQLGAEA